MNETNKKITPMEMSKMYVNIQDEIKKNNSNCNNAELSENIVKYIQAAITPNDERGFIQRHKNLIVESFINEEKKNLKMQNILELLNKRYFIRDVYFISDDFTIVKIEDNFDIYFTIIVNDKITNHFYDTFDKALIGAISYKYNVHDFAYNAMAAMCGIND